MSGVVRQPFYLSMLIVAAVITWLAPQSWDWSRRMPLWKSILVTGLIWLALAAMSSQEYNPFIYFIF